MAAKALSRLRRAFVARLGAVLRLDDPPWRVALALAIGVFISCTPFWGLQTVLSLAVATIFRDEESLNAEVEMESSGVEAGRA